MNFNTWMNRKFLTACLQTREALEYTDKRPLSLKLDCLVIIEKDKQLIDKAKKVLPKILVQNYLNDHLDD